MKYDATTILTGIFLLFLFSYVLITVFNFIFMGAAGQGHKVKGVKMMLASAVVTLAWIISTVLAIWFTASIGVLVFSIFALVLIFGASYFLAEKLIGVTGKHKLIYSLLLAVLFNPGWLTLVGIL
jgi:hypothetical protein